MILTGGLRRRNPPMFISRGSKTYEAIPPCIDLFDVALIPFKISDLSDATDPIKLYEYFALGKPVVASRTAAIGQV